MFLAIISGHIDLVQLFLNAGANVKAVDNQGQNAYHHAVSHGRTKILQLLVKKDKSLLNAKDKEKNTPLVLTAVLVRSEYVKKHGVSSHVEIMDILLEAGADPTITDSLGRTSLHWAAEGGQTMLVRRLLNHSRDLLKIKNQLGDFPLHSAAASNKEGCKETCEALLAAGADVGAINSLGENAFQIAIKRGKAAVVRLFARDASAREATDREGNTPLHFAISLERQDVVDVCEALLAEGARVEATNAAGQNALQAAIAQRKASVVRLLAKNKQLLNAVDKGGNAPLLLATHLGDLEICKNLIKAGADRYAANPDGHNFFHVATAYGKTEIIRFFILERGLLETKDRFGNTPLLLAAYFGHLESFKILFNSLSNAKTGKSGGAAASVEATNHHKQNALHLAAVQGHDEIVTFLLQQPKSRLLEAQDKEGATPLILAASFNRATTCAILLRHNASIGAVTHQQQNALHLAAALGHIEALIALTTQGKRRVDLQMALEARDMDQETPLLLAAYFGHENTFPILEKAGADLNAKNPLGQTYLGMTEVRKRVAQSMASGGQASDKKAD